MAKKRLGRPPQFTRRARFMVLLEATELRELQGRAETEGVSASAFVRSAILRAFAERSPRRARRK